jgi:hypothetical protein
MRGVDLERYPFDFDLTFTVLLMHPDGTIYHRYGGRDHQGANVWLNQPSLVRLLGETVKEHEAYSASPDPPSTRTPRAIEEVPAFAAKDKGECIHCHSVFPALREDLISRKSWNDADDIWVYPSPEQVGLRIGREDQTAVTGVEPGSAAHEAGVRSGDRLVSLGRQRLLTASDLQWALQELPPGETDAPLRWLRDGKTNEGILSLAAGWKRGTPLTFSWRPLKWALLPAPGFGGQPLPDGEKQALGIAPGGFAFRVGYLVTWNEHRRFGEEAIRAGLRKGDVVTRVDGKTDFRSVDHFHAWWRLEKKPGEKVVLDIVRDGRRRTVEVEVLE